MPVFDAERLLSLFHLPCLSDCMERKRWMKVNLRGNCDCVAFVTNGGERETNKTRTRGTPLFLLSCASVIYTVRHQLTYES